MEKLNAFEVFVGSNLATILYPLDIHEFFLYKKSRKFPFFPKLINQIKKGWL
jgi:hypothetical protein